MQEHSQRAAYVVVVLPQENVMMFDWKFHFHIILDSYHKDIYSK